MSTAVAVPRSVSSGLEEVAKWRAESEAKRKRELADMDQEIDSLTTAIANLQQQIEALRRSREDMVRRAELVDDEEIDRSYNAIFGVLGAQAEALRARSVKVAESEAKRASALAAALQGGEAAALLQEYNQFKSTVEPTLAALPESYRSVILQHHQAQAAKLREYIEKAAGAAGAIEGEVVPVEVVFAVDAPEGTPEVLMLVLPVEEQVQSAWSDRVEDAQTWVAARTVQAVYQACKSAGLTGAQAAFGGHQGLLAVELEIAGARGDIASIVKAELTKVLTSAPELQSARIQARCQQVLVDHLLPPEEDEEGGDA